MLIFIMIFFPVAAFYAFMHCVSKKNIYNICGF